MIPAIVPPVPTVQQMNHNFLGHLHQNFGVPWYRKLIEVPPLGITKYLDNAALIIVNTQFHGVRRYSGSTDKMQLYAKSCAVCRVGFNAFGR